MYTLLIFPLISLSAFILWIFREKTYTIGDTVLNFVISFITPIAVIYILDELTPKRIKDKLYYWFDLRRISNIKLK